jgi:hypothetical protein
MERVERIEVRKFYVGRAALFGLLYGLLFGVIFGVVFFLSVLIGDVSLTQSVGNVGVGLGLIVSFGIVIFSAIWISVIMVVSALLYNIIVKMGGAIHLGLAEFDIERVSNQGGEYAR